jgi:gliding motility-associated-like protein
MARVRLLLILQLLLGARSAWAQGENNNWAFGFLQGLAFGTGEPVYLPTNMQNTTTPGVVPNGFGSHSTISDAQGKLLFYTDGSTVWDSEHRPMTNACTTCDGAIAQLNTGKNAWRSALIVKRPGSTSLYYVFTVDSQQNLFNGGLSYTEVDMTLRGGRGGVTAVRNVRLPTLTLTSQLSEGLAGMQHTNHRDVWVVVHGLTDGAFYSFLVTAAGVSSTPIPSTSGSYSNRISIMKFSPDGKRLARCGFVSTPVELFDFDGATGTLTNQQLLEPASNLVVNDIEFSPDATKLYQLQAIGGVPPIKYQGALYQYDLLAGSPAAIRSSKLLVAMSPSINQEVWSCLEIGPDGRIYMPLNPEMSIIDRPNRRGSGTGFRYVGMAGFANATKTYVGVNTSQLQNIVRPQPPALDYVAEPICAGGAVTLTPYEVPTGTGPLTWTFYDPLTGRADSVQGVTVTRTYPVPGVYPVTLSTVSRGQYYRFRRNVVVSPLPVAALPDTTRLCFSNALLSVPVPLGTTVLWSDGSTGSHLQVTTPGRYQVEVRNYLGCASTGTTMAVACRVPNIITPNGDAVNETFRLEGMKAKQWSLAIYNRWGGLVYQKDSYDNAWNAAQQPPGTYYYRLYNSQNGQQLKGWVEVVR